MSTNKFPLGQTVATPAILEAIGDLDVQMAMQRHVGGDWGEVDKEDWESNNQALIDGNRLLSVYSSGKGTKFWIITEADRSVTTVLLPSDY